MTGLIILVCVLSRMVAVPVYLRQLGWVGFDPGLDIWFNRGSTVLLFTAGIGGAGMILYKVARAHVERQRIHTTLLVSRPTTEDPR